MDGITFNAILNRISTTIDGGWRVTFDVPQSDAQQMLKLSEHRHESMQIGIVPINQARDHETTEADE